MGVEGVKKKILKAAFYKIGETSDEAKTPTFHTIVVQSMYFRHFFLHISVLLNPGCSREKFIGNQSF